MVLLPGPGRQADLHLPLPLVDLVGRKSVLLRAVQVRSGNYLVVLENFRALTTGVVGRNLVLVRMILLDCCCCSGMFPRWDLDSTFCCSQSS